MQGHGRGIEPEHRGQEPETFWAVGACERIEIVRCRKHPLRPDQPVYLPPEGEIREQSAERDAADDQIGRDIEFGATKLPSEQGAGEGEAESPVPCDPTV